MESTSTNLEAMKPLLIKAGIPLAISIASFIFAKKYYSYSYSYSFSKSSSHKPLKNLDHQNDEISNMRIRIKNMQEKVCEQELRFVQYQDLKEEEVMIMELQNKLLLEITSIEFIEKEIALMEDEGERIENMVIDYMKVMEFLQLSRSENQLLDERVKMLLKKIGEYYFLVKGKDLEIEGKEMEICRNIEELGKKGDVIRKLENEMKELKMAIEIVESEKHELLSKIDLAENSTSLKIDGEGVNIEDYNKLLSEHEQLQKDRAAETKELIFLRWCHACSRHELMRRNQEQEKEMELHNNNKQQIVELHYGSDNEVNNSSDDSCLGFSTSGHVHHHKHGSRRRKLVEKLKKWVDHHHGSDDQKSKEKSSDEKKEKHDEHYKLFRRHDRNNVLVTPRNSFSSV